jgi:hypothetical protein
MRFMNSKRDAGLLGVVWLVLAISLSFAVIPLRDYLDYLGGKRLLPLRFLLFPITVVLGAWLALPPFVKLLRAHRELMPVPRLFLSLSAALIFIAPFTLSLVFKKPIQRMFTKGFLVRLEKDVDSRKLQRWAVDELSAHWETRQSTNTDSLIEAQVPDSIKSLSSHPPNIYVGMLSGEVSQPHLTIMWGSGFGHWGLLVGSDTLVVSNVPRFYFVKWRPGMYAFFSE